MLTRTTILRATGAVAAVALLVAALGAATGARTVMYRTASGEVILPAVQIISFNDGVGRLDTTSGAVHILSGDLDNPSVRNEWVLRVPAVKESHSGLLDIQQPTFNNPDATFLVDVATGKTWLLRRTHEHKRDSAGYWQPVEVVR